MKRFQVCASGVLAVSLLSCMVAVSASAQRVQRDPLVIQANHVTTTIPARDMVDVGWHNLSKAMPEHDRALHPHISDQPDTALQNVILPPVGTTNLLSFDGITFPNRCDAGSVFLSTTPGVQQGKSNDMVEFSVVGNTLLMQVHGSRPPASQSPRCLPALWRTSRTGLLAVRSLARILDSAKILLLWLRSAKGPVPAPFPCVGKLPANVRLPSAALA